MGPIRFPTMKNWKFLFCVSIPFLLLPIAFLGDESDTKKFKSAYTIILMGIFWMLEVLPLSITALFPIFLFPVFGIQTTSDVVANYMTETQMMFFGGITIALGLQACGLHKRIALRTIILIGSSPWRLLLGILVTTTVLSCVIIVNTAVAAMMVPIVSEVIEALGESVDNRRKRNLRISFMLAVAYGANIGGTATIIGSQSAVIYKNLIEKENVSQHGKYLDLNFLTYSAYAMPIAAINLFVSWLIIGGVNLGFETKKKLISISTDSESTAQKPYGRAWSISSVDLEQGVMGDKLITKYRELGSMTFHELAVLTLLILAVALWFMREPQVVPGWGALFTEMSVGDASIAIGVTVVMFIIPRKLAYFHRNYDGPGETLMTWKYHHEHFPWNVILIVGGGLAISDGAEVSGLSEWLGMELMGLESLPREVLLLVLLLTLSIFTEFMSNTATVALLTPILIGLSRQLNIHPLYLTLPGSIACQYAFVFPTSNPPNAVVFSAGDMKIGDMAKTGILLNFSCVTVLYLMNLTWGEYVLFTYRDYVYPVNASYSLHR